MNEISSMTDRELLEELLAAKRRQETLQKVRLGIHVCVLLLIVWLGLRYIPPIIAFCRELKEGIDQIASLGETLAPAFEQIGPAMEQIGPALEKIQELNIDPKTLEELTKQIGRITDLLDKFSFLFG